LRFYLDAGIKSKRKDTAQNSHEICDIVSIAFLSLCLRFYVVAVVSRGVSEQLVQEVWVPLTY